MNENKEKYSIYPLVIEANKKSTISIFSKMSCDGSESLVNPWEKVKTGGTFVNSKVYEIKVEPREIKESKDYIHEPIQYEILNGYILFEHVFKEEQEHIIYIYERFKNESIQIALLKVYSIYDDLYKLTPYKGELHMHSNFSDGKHPPEIMYTYARQAGMEFAILTDHHQLQPTLRIQRILKKLDTGMKIYRGEEVHKTGLSMHIVSFGAKKSISKLLRENSEKYENEALKIASEHETLPIDIEPLEYGMQRVVYEQIQKAGGISILAHPYWPYKNGATNIPTSLSRLTIKEGYADAWEITGVDDGDKDFMQNILYMEEIKKGNNMPVVGCTDAHNKNDLGDSFSIVFAMKNDFKSLSGAIKNNLCIGARKYKRIDGKMRYMAFGPTRLTRYAMFLMSEFYEVQDRLCSIEGQLMLEYVTGNNWSKKLIGEVAKHINKEKKLCFGREMVSIDK